jgi:phosphoribosylanthranilate isomerase
MIVASGADAIGLVFYEPSPRAVSAEQAVEIVREIPAFVSVVALFVDEAVAGIEHVLNLVPVNVLQFHGSESAQFCGQFERPYVKALRVNSELDIHAACRDHAAARGALLDAWQEGVPGGTGRSFDWNLALPDSALSLPLIVAGGLDDKNVGAAIKLLRPSAVDVSGGVESAPGIKDAEKVRRFIAAVSRADQQVDGRADEQ